jgi:hypothetical protein
MDTRLDKIYFDFMTYYITSNMTPITCSLLRCHESERTPQHT